ncbi:FKBP-type peptidyl-prolyl cis-trans isomerase [Daejeonella oryzae]|uniref:FKBP-type peptidyl-prolyl cis-trans isomerase n=1 Tax=Daejeonella oryzae TaxID=1122943 RepID=UPI000414AB0E|nr:FKBP-type peptidyl-prolyl cis-trans isomerase [Daejeonella oryzae]
MKVRYLFLFFIALTITISSCKKTSSVDPEKQFAADEVLIKDFIAKNNITAIRHESGVYYQIIAPGSGSTIYSANTSVSAKYKGRLLSGSVFDEATANPISFKLGGVIVGWQIGVPLIQKGGKIRLLIPSAYGYGQSSAGSIPANSVLDFDIELVDVQN